jgi:mRNA interferase RelE/StbE
MGPSLSSRRANRVTEVRVVMLPPFKRAYKKLHNKQKVVVDEAVSAIMVSPEVGEPKRGDLAGVYVYKFDCLGQQFLLAYEWNPELRILRALGVHENFYRDLKRVP